MHGAKRIRQTREAFEAKKLREKGKLKDYLALTDIVITRKKNKDWSTDAFDLTTRLLQVNPEFYTIWNYRRNIMLKGLFLGRPPAEINELLANDLSLTTGFLKHHPKVYWIWNHRRWCLENVPEGPHEGDPQMWRKANWDKELFVVERMLDADARNFHAWNYRRYVLASMPVQRSDLSELKYTTGKIESNFSNFSAWHQRSKVLMSMWDAGKLDPKQSKEEEFELVKNAMYTDPGDQSVWIYHKWLIGPGDDIDIVRREISGIQELLDEQQDSKWCMESLVYYKKLLLRHPISDGERISLSRECLGTLETLKILDPLRKRRYDDLAERLNTINA